MFSSKWMNWLVVLVLEHMRMWRNIVLMIEPVYVYFQNLNIIIGLFMFVTL